MSITAQAYFLDVAGQPLVRRELELPDPGPDEVIVEVKGCGLCHTDLGYADGSVPPKHALPLVLGHEVMGQVVMAGEAYRHLLDRAVIVPAVLPCGDCAFCRAGRSNACPRQQMPGNDIDGGFSSHMIVPAAPLVAVPTLPAGFDPRALSVVADAVSTAWQATRRADLQAGDVAIVVGAGGVGGFVAQIASALGAHVIACDISDARLAALAELGEWATVNVADMAERDVRGAVQGFIKPWGVPSFRHRIFECSGSPQGQSLAWTLTGRASTVAVVGYTFDKVTLRLSNLMAFDATAVGTWGCPPSEYPAVVDLILNGRVALDPFIAYAPMATVSEQLDAMAAHKLDKRVVLDPRM